MASSLPLESLSQALLAVLVVIFVQVFLEQRRASQPSKHTEENFANVLAAIACLSSKHDQKQLHEKQYRLEIRSKLKNLQTDIDTIKSALRARPSENELFIQLHQKVLREVRELEGKIKKANSLPPAVPAAPPTAAPAVLPTAAPIAVPPPKQGAPEPPTSVPDQSGILTISDSEEEENDDDVFAPGGDYNASAPWE